MENYGKELIIDLHNCDSSIFTRKDIKKYFTLLCEQIDMKTEKLCWWDDYGIEQELRQTESHTKGTTAVQFILTSNITIHTLDILKNVYVNIFSCKDFDEQIAQKYTKEYFKGDVVQTVVINRL